MPDKLKEENPDQDKKNSTEQEKVEGEEAGYSDIVTADGERLKNIDGGYTISGMGADPDEMDFISV